MNINKYGQIANSDKENEALFEESKKTTTEEPEQLGLPGIEPGIERVRGKGEEETYLKDKTYQRDKILNIRDNQMELNPDWDINSNKLRVKRYQESSGLPEGFTYPSPNYFINLNDDQLSKLFESKESYRKQIEGVLKKVKEKNTENREDLEEAIISTYEEGEKELQPFSIIRREYDRFYNLYNRWYVIYRESVALSKRIPNPYRRLNSMKERPLVEIMREVGVLLKDAINYVSTDLISKNTLPVEIFSYNGNERDINPFLQASKVMEGGIYSWEKRIELMGGIEQEYEERFENMLMDEEFSKSLRVFDQSYPQFKEKFLDSLFRALGLLYYHYDDNFMNEIRSISNNTISILQRTIDKIESEVSCGQHEAVNEFSDQIRKIYKEEAEKIFRKIHERTEEISKDEGSDLNKRFEEVKRLWSPYCDLINIDKMINFGVLIDGGQRDMTSEIKEAWMLKVIKDLSNKKLFEDLTVWPNENIYKNLASYPDHESRVKGLIDIAREIILKNSRLRINREISSSDDYNFNLKNRYLNNLLKSKTHIDELHRVIVSPDGIDFTGRGMIAGIVSQLSLSEEEGKIIEKYLGNLLRAGKYNKLVDFRLMASEQFLFMCVIKILRKFGKLSIDNIVILMDKIITIPIDDNYNNVDTFSYNNFVQYLPLSKRSPDDASTIVANGVRSLESLHNDLPSINELTKIMHNNTEDMDEELILGILKTKNISILKRYDGINFKVMNSASKYYELLIKIVNAGGYDGIKSKYGEVIERLKEDGSISDNIEDMLEDFADIIRHNRELNPKNPKFREDMEIINKLDSDIDLILNYKLYDEYYNEAKQYKKVDNLFNLDLQIGSGVRFRVLRDGDARHFRVGVETQCCQRPGGAGEVAMIDSFVNDHAGVLVLEVLDNDSGGWELAAQSYFHYVPPNAEGSIGAYEPKMDDEDDILDNWDDDDFEVDPKGEERSRGGYILDNVEIVDKYSKGINGIAIEQYYAFLALKKKEELGIGFFESGIGYSKISSNKFGSSYWDRDPRKFHVRRPYVDWHNGDNNIDLLNPDFEVSIPGLTPSADKAAKLSWEFLRMVLGA